MATKLPPHEGGSFGPSALPDWKGNAAIGIVLDTADEPRVAPFMTALAVEESLLELSGPVNPTKVFRFSAPCLMGGCQHFREQRCNLITQIVQILPIVVDTLPTCVVRSSRQWWQQEGRAACMRCPQVVTANYNPHRRCGPPPRHPRCINFITARKPFTAVTILLGDCGK